MQSESESVQLYQDNYNIYTGYCLQFDRTLYKFLGVSV